MTSRRMEPPQFPIPILALLFSRLVPVRRDRIVIRRLGLDFRDLFTLSLLCRKVVGLGWRAKVAKGEKVITPSLCDRLGKPPRIVQSPFGLHHWNLNMGMLLNTHLGLEETVKPRASGLDKPPLFDEITLLALTQAVTATINLAGKPVLVTPPHSLLEVAHCRFLPPKTLHRPLPENLQERVAAQGPCEEGAHPAKHGAFVTPSALQILASLPGPMRKMPPRLPTITPWRKPNPSWPVLLEQRLQSRVRFLPVEVIAVNMVNP